ncbi:uncharacterized protein H6S33_008881 [Morchella sextelata]|uniref:uncharacterized protein n=1 Tax=Morchella sextelata TaxID=1174677 RepID=UPI001D03A4D6|nr:uncharacterized protein H6S33_008881 [Morchella sextelata]KAH0612501.1 hypothetical protein H6S33_008881 [Morchella sextelata]
MAPPAVVPSEPLPQRLMALAQTLQFGWFVGHLTLLLTTFRYAVAAVKFSTSTTGASIAYRVGFLSAAVTYGIVVYKAYRTRMRSGQLPTGQQGAVQILSDENVQYLFMALVWLYSKPIFFALLPFAVYSTFHFLTYLRTNLIPVVIPSPATPAGTKAPAPAVSEAIAKFVRNNYDYSMHLVANLELFLWLRILAGAIIFKNSWILLAIYTAFLRVRFAQSGFVKDAVKGLERRGDAITADAGVPEGVRSAWAIVKTGVKSFGDVSDLSKFMSAPPATDGAARKTQ